MKTVTRPGISESFLTANDIHHVDKDEVKLLIGQQCSGLWIPYHYTTGIPIEDKETCKPFGRIRLDNPVDGMKYSQSAGSRIHIYTPSNLTNSYTKDYLIVVEGEFKALAMFENGYPAIGIGGLHNFTNGKNGSSELNSEFVTVLNNIPDTITTIHYLGDGDVSLNFDYSKAACKFAKLVQEKYPKLKICLPHITLKEEKGVDDNKEKLGTAFDAWLDEKLVNAIPIDSKQSEGVLCLRLLKMEKENLLEMQGNNPEEFDNKIFKMACALESAGGSVFTKFKDLMEDEYKIRSKIFNDNLKKMKQRLRDKNPQEKTSTPLPPSSLPKLFLPSEMTLIDHSAKELANILGGKNYFRRGKIVQRLNVATNEIEIVKSDGLRSVMQSSAQCVRTRIDISGVEKAQVAYPTRDDANVIIDSQEFGLPVIDIICPCPMLVIRNGKPHVIIGMDNESHRYAHGTAPETMTLDEAIKLLVEMISDFDFQSDGDRARALAAIISPCLQLGKMLKDEKYPVVLFEADGSQTGKGFFVKLIASLYASVSHSVVHDDDSVGSLNEKLSSHLITGRAFICFENLKGELDSSCLESFLTEPNFLARPAYHEAVIIYPRNHIISITSNGFKPTKDLVCRMLPIAIKKRPLSYRFKKYPEGNIENHIKAHQPKYLGAVYTIVKHWIEKGCLRTDEYRHDFREWISSMDFIISTIIKQGKIGDGLTATKTRLLNPRFQWFRSLCIAVKDQGKLRTKLNTTHIIDILIQDSLEVPGLVEGKIFNQLVKEERDHVLTQVGRWLGEVFKNNGDEVKMTGFKIVRTVEENKQWRSNQKLYEFEECAMEDNDETPLESSLEGSQQGESIEKLLEIHEEQVNNVTNPKTTTEKKRVFKSTPIECGYCVFNSSDKECGRSDYPPGTCMWLNKPIAEIKDLNCNNHSCQTTQHWWKRSEVEKILEEKKKEDPF